MREPARHEGQAMRAAPRLFLRRRLALSLSQLASGSPEEEGADQGAGGRSFLVCMPFWVFNVAQIDGLPVELIDAHCYPGTAPYSPAETAMRIIARSNAQTLLDQ